MWRNSENVERVCGRVFLIVFLFALPVVWVRVFLGGKTDPFENESRYANEMPALNAKNVWHGTFQKDIESAISDQIPSSESIRDKVLSLDGAIFENLSWLSKRQGTKYHLVADNMFAYGDYEYLLRPQLSQNWLNFKNSDSEESAKIREVLTKSNDYYSNLPIRNKYIYYVTTDQAVNFDHPENDFVEQIVSFYPSFKYDKLKINSIEDYAKYYQKNDHHWNYEGSYKGYTEIIKMMLGKDEKVLEPAEKVVFDYDGQGSKSKGAHFFKFKEKWTAYRFDLPAHETTVDGEKREYGDQDKYFNVPGYRNGTGNLAYGDFYGYDFGVINYDYKNTDKPNLVMIGHSDTNAINALVASHFNKTWIIDPRFCSREQFEEILSKNHVDYLLITPNTSDFIPELISVPKGYESAV